MNLAETGHIYFFFLLRPARYFRAAQEVAAKNYYDSRFNNEYSAGTRQKWGRSDAATRYDSV